MNKKNKIIEYINDQISQVNFRSKAYVFDAQNNIRPRRYIFQQIESYLDKFLNGNKAYRWISLTGLRGVGKTTLMYQLYYFKKNIDAYFLVLSVDEITETLNSNINEIINVFEEIIGRSISNLDKPLLLFLDEVQYDKKWGSFLKTIYDKSSDVFIFSTGSAAALINSNPDLARRTIYEKIYPLSFTEFLKIKENINEIDGLSFKIKEALFNSKNSEDAYLKLLKCKNTINKYYLGVNRLNFENYLNFGSLPFMIALDNESIVYDQINKSLDRVINKDISQIKSISFDVINKISAILYAVADMDVLNFTKLSDEFDIPRYKISEIFNALEKAEILHRIYPHGSHFNQVTKRPSKYLFSSPAFRSMYYKTIGNTISIQNSRGKLLEDLVGMYLYKTFDKQINSFLTFDSAEGGADFIYSSNSGRIIIEVGVNKKEYKQIIKTSKKVKSKYNIVISENQDKIELNKNINTLKIPLSYFILIN